MTRFDRISGSDLDRLKVSAVLVVGLGSGGSTVALELAKAGVGRLILCDPDSLEEANVMRHECDDGYLGWTKPRAVADLVVGRNPAIDVSIIESAVEDIESGLPQLIASVDAVAVCTDTDASRHLIDRLAADVGVPVVFGGVYAGARGGEIITCTNGGEDACLACVETGIRAERPNGPAPAYGVELDALASVPGMGVDVRIVALLHAKEAIAILTGDAGTENVLMFSTVAIDELLPRPYASARARVRRRADCLMCGAGTNADAHRHAADGQRRLMPLAGLIKEKTPPLVSASAALPPTYP